MVTREGILNVGERERRRRKGEKRKQNGGACEGGRSPVLVEGVTG